MAPFTQRQRDVFVHSVMGTIERSQRIYRSDRTMGRFPDSEPLAVISAADGQYSFVFRNIAAANSAAFITCLREAVSFLERKHLDAEQSPENAL